MKLVHILTIVICLMAHEARASCANARLDLDPLALGKVPAWQQRKISACPAYAATQLIDAERARVSNGRLQSHTSPVELAIRSVDVFGGGGLTEVALNEARVHGVCDASSVRRALGASDDTSFITKLSDIYSKSRGQSQNQPTHRRVPIAVNKGKALYSASDDLDPLAPRFGREYSLFDDMAARNWRKRELNEVEKRCVEQTVCYLRTLGVRDQVNRLKHAVEEWIREDRRTFLQNAIEKICPRSQRINVGLPPAEIIPIEGLKARGNPYSFSPAAETLITTRLKNRKPVAINFCNEVVLDPSHRPLIEKGQPKCRRNGEHAAVIVGSRRTALGCEFLVRDSYCSEYSKKLTVLGAIRRYAPVFGNPSPKDFYNVCDRGQYWINSNQLLANTDSLVVLK